MLVMCATDGLEPDLPVGGSDKRPVMSYLLKSFLYVRHVLDAFCGHRGTEVRYARYERNMSAHIAHFPSQATRSLCAGYVHGEWFRGDHAGGQFRQVTCSQPFTALDPICASCA